jgi:L-threonylcarbamoyladenylate synthase
METITLPVDDPQALTRALMILESQGLVAFPTDTVYGMGGQVFNERAIQQIFIVKGREESKAIPVLLSDPDELSLVTDRLNDVSRCLAARFWPGPLTLVVPKHPSLPTNLSPYSTIGVRIPNHPTALALLRLSGPLAVTSANLSGQINTTTAEEVFKQLGGQIPLILDGGCTPGGKPSTVVDCTAPDPIILRQGPISAEQIWAALG